MIIQDLKNFVFIDIETVPEYKDFNTFYNANPVMADLWLKKAEKFYTLPEFKDVFDIHNVIYKAKASFYPEFSKIVAVGLGMFIEKEGKLVKHIKVFADEVEDVILTQLKEASIKLEKLTLFGFNIISFDNPFICKRFIYNGYQIPKLFDHTNLKPWEKENKVFDLMKVIQFGSYEQISVDLLCNVCGIESPKRKMNGSEVMKYYYEIEGGLKEIVEYNHDDLSSMMDLAVYLKNLK